MNKGLAVALTLIGLSFIGIGGFSIISINFFGFDSVFPPDTEKTSVQITSSPSPTTAKEDGEVENDTNITADHTINGNTVSGKIEKEKQIITYKYTAPVSGIYEFKIISDAKIRIRLKKASDSEITYDYMRVVSNLEKGKTYLIVLEQYEYISDFTMNIGVPDDVKTISGSKINGQIRYQSQVVPYNYVAPLSGKYEFKVTSDAKIRIRLKNSAGGELTYDYSRIVYDLEKGKTYLLYLEQYERMADYVLDVGVPDAISTISSNKVEGSIRYQNQMTTYNYTAPKTGKYEFNINSEAKIRIRLKNSAGGELTYDYMRILYNLEAGKTYLLVLEQYERLAPYAINIGVPDDVANITGNWLEGNIRYNGQENIYNYTAPYSGKYKFVITSDAKIRLRLKNSAGGEITYDYNSLSSELEGGKIYTLILEQYDKLGYYSLAIE